MGLGQGGTAVIHIHIPCEIHLFELNTDVKYFIPFAVQGKRFKGDGISTN